MTQKYNLVGERVLVAGGQLYVPGNKQVQDWIRSAFEDWLNFRTDVAGDRIFADPARDYHGDIVIDQFLTSIRAERVDWTQPKRKDNTRRDNVFPDGENVTIN